MPVHAHECSVLRMSYMHVQIFVWEKYWEVADHSVFHIYGFLPSTGPVTSIRWRHYLALCSCASQCVCPECLEHGITAVSEICIVNHFCSKSSVKPKPGKNGILSRKRRAAYEWMGWNCASSTTCHLAATWQSPGTEHLWMAQPQTDVFRSLFHLNKALLKWHCYTIVVSSYLKLYKFNAELYGALFLGERMWKSDVSDTFFLAFIRQIYHSCDCVLVVAQEVYGMWHLLLIQPSATGQDGGIVSVSDNQNCTHLV